MRKSGRLMAIPLADISATYLVELGIHFRHIPIEIEFAPVPLRTKNAFEKTVKGRLAVDACFGESPA